MSAWAAPGVAHLEDVVRSAEGRLLLCSPYISTPALDIVAAALPPAVRTVEVWTRLEPRDWLTGVSDPEGLLDFMRQIEDRVGQVAVRHSERLHAKVIVSDGPRALAGSANLTMGGFVHNVEAVRIVTGDETPRLRALAEGMRQRLQAVSREQFEEFVAGCTARLDSQEALLDLIRTEMPPPRFGPPPLMPYARFLEYVERYDSEVAGQVAAIARNRDGNNNTGKVKQAFFGVQRFLQEYPNRRAFAENLPDDRWFDVAGSSIKRDWRRFLDDFADEADADYGYSIPTLRRYLTPASGGTRTGGGGDNELKRVWPFAARATAP